MQELAYEIPRPANREINAAIVRAIPFDQVCMNGILNAPHELIEAGNVAFNTGHVFGRGHSIAARAPIGKSDRSSDVFGLIVERKLPDFVAFQDVGLVNEGLVGNADFRRAVIDYLLRGYSGALHIRFGIFPRLERCDMFFDVTEGRSRLRGPKHTNPPHIMLSTDDRNGGWSHQQPIIDACINLKLAEIDPDSLVRPDLEHPSFIR
ncbi:MAG: hypothetical protein RDU25_03155 [Patescibacteria group bacterium]|nr:hypothetical protein [Patescibacteria group bacterium]